MSKRPCTGCEANRITLLAQAERILFNKFKVDNERMHFFVGNGLVDPTKINWPDPPSSDEIMREAERLYSFVKEK